MKWRKAVIYFSVITIIVIFISIVGGFMFNCLLSNNFKFKLDFMLLLNGKTYLYSLLLCVIFLALWLSYYYKHYWLKRSKKIIEGDKRDNNVSANLEQARFQTEDEINKNFTLTDYASLAEKDTVGIPIKAMEHKGKYNINLAKNAHTMIIGTTGSGKTTTFINPTI